MIYNEIASILEEKLNYQGAGTADDRELYVVKYLNNVEQFNAENLIKEEQVMAIISVGAERILPESTNAKVITMQFRTLIPLGEELYDDAIIRVNNLMGRLNNAKLSIEGEDEALTVTNVNKTYDGKYPTLINGKEYHDLQFNFEVLQYPSYVWNYDANLIIDGEAFSNVINVQLNATKQMDGKVFNDGFVRPQNNGVQYSLTVEFLYDKNNTAHQKILKDYKLQQKYNIVFNQDVLEFKEDNMVLASYTKPGINGDVLKLSVTFMRGE